MKKEDKKPEQPKKPVDNAVVHVSEHVRIYDPETKEEFLNKRES